MKTISFSFFPFFGINKQKHKMQYKHQLKHNIITWQKILRSVTTNMQGTFEAYCFLKFTLGQTRLGLDKDRLTDETSQIRGTLF